MSQRVLSAKLVVYLALFFEGLLAIAGIVWANWRSIELKFNNLNLFEGIYWAAPLLLLNLVLLPRLPKEWAFMQQIERLQTELLYPLCANLGLFSALIVALISGWAEELFFRAVLNQELSRTLGTIGGLLVGSFCFAYAHFIGMLRQYYLVVAYYTLIGLYLSLEYLYLGSIYGPMITHATYNFLAIIVLRYWFIPSKYPELLDEAV